MTDKSASAIAAPPATFATPWLVQGWGYGLLLLGLGVVLLAVVALAAGVGPYRLGYAYLFGLVKRWAAGEVLSPAEATALAVFFHIRVARILLAGLVGLGLSLAGCAFQGLLLNPLADPFTLGVAAGSAFGASILTFVRLASDHAGRDWLGAGCWPPRRIRESESPHSRYLEMEQYPMTAEVRAGRSRERAGSGWRW